MPFYYRNADGDELIFVHRGQGMVETGWLLEQLHASAYDFNVIIELWPPEQETLEGTIALEEAWLQESVPYLRRFIAN